MTNCDRQAYYLITGLQPFTQYNVSVTVCAITGEGPMATVPSGMTMTLPGSPTRVQSITITNTTNTVILNWNAVQFNDVGGTYEVSLHINYSLLNGFRVNSFATRLITLVMDVEILIPILFLILPLLGIPFLVSTVMKQIVMEQLELLIWLEYRGSIVQSLQVSLLVPQCSHHQHQ